MSRLLRNALAAAALAAGCSARTADHAPPKPPKPAARTIGGFSHPESVAAAGARRFVSNIGAAMAPLAKDGDGFISELDENGGLVELRAFAPLDSPKGMAAVGGTLYVADVDRVVGFDMSTRARSFEAKSPAGSATLLNDIAAESDDALLVSDSLANAVYRLRLSDRTFSPLATGLPGANGVAVDAPRGVAYVAGIGANFAGGDLFALPLGGGEARRLGAAHGMFDGVAVLSGGGLVVSDWVAIERRVPGALTVYSAGGERVRDIAPPEPLYGPADFFYDGGRGRLWVPRALDGSVSVIDLR